MKKDEYIEKSEKTHEIKYLYDRLPDWIDTRNNQQIEVGCPLCNIYFKMRSYSFSNGGNCKNCFSSGRKKASLEEFTIKARKVHGDKYTYSGYEGNKVKIMCPLHGEFLQDTRNHLMGEGCPRCSIEKQSCKVSDFLKDAEPYLEDFEFEFPSDVIPATVPIRIRCKKCNAVFEKKRREFLNFPICPNCSEKAYTGEKEIASFLTANNIPFESHKTFPDLSDQYPLSYDFYIPSMNLLLEYNGIQHYKRVPFFQRTEEAFRKQQLHDTMKREYAKNNNFAFMVISYKDDIRKCVESILN